LLYEKLINFNITLNDIIKKINEIEGYILDNQIKYKLKTIWVNKTFSGTYKTYIIY
jgi:hypothetical protein